MKTPFEKIDVSTLDLKDQVVSINRVTKVVKGGKNLSFTALVVVGDGAGHVGYGMGIGWVAGFGTSWLLGQVVDTPRWLDAALLIGGVVAGGIVGSEYGDDDPDPDPENATTLFRVDLLNLVR